MILAYALGGGLGHVTRVRALAATMGWEEPLTILTSNPAAAHSRVRGAATVITAPAEMSRDRRGLEAFVRSTAAYLRPDQVVIDTFPRGILHELQPATFGAVPLVHVARAVRWEAYQLGPAASGTGMRFSVAYVVEPIPRAQRTFVAASSATVADIALRDVVEAARDADGHAVEDLRAAVGVGAEQPLWLVVHGGPDDETLELVAYTRELAEAAGADPTIVVITTGRPAALDPMITHFDAQPAWPLFATADRVVAGAGNNVVRQLAAHRAKTSLLPFDRRYDDQYTRARRFRDGPP